MATRTVKIAVVGATGAVGKEMLLELAEAGFTRVTPFASSVSAGKELAFGRIKLQVQEFSLVACSDFDYVLMSAGGKFSQTYTRDLLRKNGVVIDNSSAFRMDTDVPLIVPEVNAAILEQRAHKIIANPNCSTIQLVLPLHYLATSFGLDMVDVSTYQAVSGAGQKAITELEIQTRGEGEPQVFAQRIAGNVLPAIDRFSDDGHCFEEIKIVRESRKILADPQLTVHATTVRVPVYYGHSEAVTLKLKCDITREDALACLQDSPGLTLVTSDDHALLPTPLTVGNSRSVWVSRVRLPYDKKSSCWLQFFVIANNLKKGAATNALQILLYHLERITK